MGNITTPADLKNAVLLLETEQVIHLQNLREQFSRRDGGTGDGIRA